MSVTHQQNVHIPRTINVLIITFSPNVWALIVPSSGRTFFCMLKIIVTICDYIGLQLLYSYLKTEIFKTILMCFTKGL